MPRLWRVALVAALLSAGCGTVGSKPVEVEMPANRHFIVKGDADHPTAYRARALEVPAAAPEGDRLLASPPVTTTAGDR